MGRLQKQKLVTHARTGTATLRTRMINRDLTTTIAEIRPVMMVAFGVIQLTSMLSGNTAIRFLVS